MSRGEESDELSFSDRDDDVDDLGYGGGGGSSFEDDDEDDGGWGSTKHQDDLWDEPEEAALDEEEELIDVEEGAEPEVEEIEEVEEVVFAPPRAGRGSAQSKSAPAAKSAAAPKPANIVIGSNLRRRASRSAIKAFSSSAT